MMGLAIPSERMRRAELMLRPRRKRVIPKSREGRLDNSRGWAMVREAIRSVRAPTRLMTTSQSIQDGESGRTKKNIIERRPIVKNQYPF